MPCQELQLCQTLLACGESICVFPVDSSGTSDFVERYLVACIVTSFVGSIGKSDIFTVGVLVPTIAAMMLEQHLASLGVPGIEQS